MKTGERGYALVLVLILLAVGSLMVIPSLQLAYASLRAKQLNTTIVSEQYARDGAAEYAVWKLLWGGVTGLLTIDNLEEIYAVTLNGVTVELVITMRTNLGGTGVPGAEDNHVRATKTVVCDDNDVDLLYNNNCSAMPAGSGNSAKYTVTLENVSPDLTNGIVAVYDELGTGVSCKTTPCVATSPDLSFLEMTTVIPTDIGSNIWKWDFSLAPVFFTSQGEKKKFEFEVNLPGGGSSKRVCNQVFLKMQTAPHEKSGKTAVILMGGSPPGGCAGGGVTIEKFVDGLVLQPGQTTKATYIINVQNMAGFTEQVRNIKDVLPQGTSLGTEFQFCNPASPPVGFTCDAPMYKLASAPFIPPSQGGPADGFTNIAGFSNLNTPTITAHPTQIRWELFWNFLNTGPPCALPGGCTGSGQSLSAAGGATDVLIIRFQAYVTPEASGSYYNEVFVDTDCVAPGPLTTAPNNVTTDAEYCASYSWPTGGMLVPAYDVRADSGDATGVGNVSLTDTSGSLDSWFVENK